MQNGLLPGYGGDGAAGRRKGERQVVAARRAVDVEDFSRKVQAPHYARFHRRRVHLVERDSSNRDNRLLQRTRPWPLYAYSFTFEHRLDRQIADPRPGSLTQIMLNEALAVVNRRAAQAKRLAIDFTPVFVQSFSATGDDPRACVLKAASCTARDARI